MLTLKDFDYELPKGLIASYPTPKRSEARLLVLDRARGRMAHRVFKDLSDYLQEGDLLVLNNTKVLPARLFGRKPTGGKVEALLLKQIEETIWELLVRPSGRIKKGTRILFGENGVRLEGEILDEPSGSSGIRKIRFDVGTGPGARPFNSEDRISGAHGGAPLHFNEILSKIGRIPLPPYIDRPSEERDRELYQTVFAEVEGAVASPTAGLHFDEELLGALQRRGIEICFVTLHVSYGTFQPVQMEDLSKHQMYEEEFEISEEAAEQIGRAKSEGRRIVACGTTVVRTLETVGRGAATAPLQSVRGKTHLFIYPPYEFQVVDAMITNFHLPQSTLLMLVAAFLNSRHPSPAARSQDDVPFWRQIYAEAIRGRYRFYSYGDAMFIL